MTVEPYLIALDDHRAARAPGAEILCQHRFSEFRTKHTAGGLGVDPAMPHLRKRTRLLLADDHPLVRRGLCAWLEHHLGLEVVGEGGDGLAAVHEAGRLSPDLVLMDLHLPRIGVLATTELLQAARPEVKVVILCTYWDDSLRTRISECGAHGLVLKTASHEGLVCALESVLADQPLLNPGPAVEHRLGEASDGRKLAALTACEREVLRQIAEGSTCREIAIHLDLSLRTIQTRRESLMRKLNIYSVAGLTKFAIITGVSPLLDNVGASACAV
jgi:DNA-binding NarL/FixJ family response regulator